jgi:hypothetical protein
MEVDRGQLTSALSQPSFLERFDGLATSSFASRCTICFMSSCSDRFFFFYVWRIVCDQLWLIFKVLTQTFHQPIPTFAS